MSLLAAIVRSRGVESLGWQYRWLTLLAWAGRLTVRGRLTGMRRLHLGCGPHVLDGWANLDLAGTPGSIRWNLGWKLPLPDDSVDLIFSEHFIEHIDKPVALRWLRDCCRVLASGGVLRLSTPSLEVLVDAYSSGRLDDWRDVHWMPASPADLINEGMRSWGHRFLYDEVELTRVLRSAGFGIVRRCAWRESAVAGLAELEQRPDHGELILEAIK